MGNSNTDVHQETTELKIQDTNEEELTRSLKRGNDESLETIMNIDHPNLQMMTDNGSTGRKSLELEYIHAPIIHSSTITASSP